jgi:hypothetical protein
MTEFANYTKILLSALSTNPKANEVISKKFEIISSIYDFHNIAPVNTLFVGFNPAIMNVKTGLHVTAIDQQTLEYIKEQNPNVTYIDFDELSAHYKKFDSVIAFDEFFTFAKTDDEQQQLIKLICSLARQVVISTVKDYKNQDFKDKEFSSPAVIRNGAENKLFLEFHNWNFKDRANWDSYTYEIDTSNGFVSHGPFARRTMYFKQLAKFSNDAGAVHFQVHKNLMYKSLIKKNYEHVISIIFE